MKITLQPPYSNNFIAGYLNVNKEPRRVVLLVKEDRTKTSTSYARYLMSCHLNRYLSKHEHVDHIDNNPMNDTVENLQVLSSKENNIKKNIYLGIELEKPIQLVCPICKKLFEKPANKVKHKLLKGRIIACSRSCGGKMSHLKLNS